MLGWELPPHHSGGLGVVSYQLCKYLARTGADIDFILPYTADFDIDFMRINPTDTRSAAEILGFSSVYNTGFNINEQGSGLPGHIQAQQDNYISSVARIVRYGEHDVIHAHDWLTLKAAMLAKQISGKPLIVHIHSTEYDRSGGGYGNPVVREIEYIGMMMADKIIAVSDATKRILVHEYSIPENKIEVVHNSLEIDGYQEIADTNVYTYLDAMKRRGYGVVLSAGRLTIQKGLTNLLHAAKRVVEHQPKTLFLFVGAGEQYHELIQLSTELGIARNVIFAGYLNGTGKEWRDSFRIADLFVMPSVSEPFGVAALEAVGYGTPVLLSKQCGVAEVLRGSLQVDFWDADEMANQIVAVLRSSGLKKELLQKAQSEYNHLSWENTANKVLSVYDTQLSEVSK